MPFERLRPAQARWYRQHEDRLYHEKVIIVKWQEKYGKILEKSTERIGIVDVVKPYWWKQAEFDVSEEAGQPRPLDEVIPIVKLPPKVRRFPPHKEPGPEITEHLPPMSLMYPVNDDERGKVISEYRGVKKWLRERSKLPMNERFCKPANINGFYGWGAITQDKEGNEGPERRFGRAPVLKTEFYRQRGVINGKNETIRLDLSGNDEKKPPAKR